MPSILRVGGYEVGFTQAQQFITEYVSPGNGSPTGYVYDRFQTGSDADGLNDADLLAPNLLNAPVQLKRFAALRSVRDEVESHLASIPQGLELSAASDADLVCLGPLFEVLDGLKASRSGVGAVVFSKVLHRKRPRLIPIIDINVLHCYQKHPTREAARVPFATNRSWAEFVVLLAGAMRDDLTAALDEWDRLTALTIPPLTHLRALDIVAWRLGDHPPLRGEEDP
jgi:Family of unknown function (DUF6308)